MGEVTDGGFPRRDARRRIVAARDFMAVMLAGAIAGAVALVVLDALFAVIGLGDFGRINGWLAVILPVMLLVEEFRAWQGARGRLIVAVVAAAVAVAAGLLVAGLAGLAGDLAGLLAGALGAIGFSAAYAPLWFYGIRLASGEAADR